MAQFDESKVINGLHPEKAEVGKKYWCSDSITFLKDYVEQNNTDSTGELSHIKDAKNRQIFCINSAEAWEFIYPYEEPPKQRMTYLMLSEWLAKGNGIFKRKDREACFTCTVCSEELLNKKVDEDIIIRSWDSEEWVEPIIDIYERDCKGDKQCDCIQR